MPFIFNSNFWTCLLWFTLIDWTLLGITVVNITFDGLRSNVTACKEMGASFKFNDFRPYFHNRLNGKKIVVIFDACHMVKLARNYWFSHKRQRQWYKVISLDYLVGKNIKEFEGSESTAKLIVNMTNIKTLIN